MEDRLNYFNLSEMILGEAATCFREVLVHRYNRGKRGKFQNMRVNDRRWTQRPVPLTIRFFKSSNDGIRFYPFMRFSSFIFDHKNKSFKHPINKWDFSSLYQILSSSYELPLKTKNSRGDFCDRFQLSYLRNGLIKQKVGNKVFVISKKHIRNVMMMNSKASFLRFQKGEKLPSFSRFGFFNPNGYTTPEEALREIRNAFIGHTSNPTLNQKTYDIVIEWVYESIKELYSGIGMWNERKKEVLCDIKSRRRFGKEEEEDEISSLVDSDSVSSIGDDDDFEDDLFSDENGILPRSETEILQGSLGNYEIIKVFTSEKTQ